MFCHLIALLAHLCVAREKSNLQLYIADDFLPSSHNSIQEHGRRKLRTTRSSARSSARSSVKVYASYSLAKKTKKRKSHSYDDDDDDDEDDDGDDEAEGYEGYESENSNVQVIVLRGFTSLAFYLLF
eukprot:GHVH01003963.1.p1 GENE.GHVH01003963.1~~GHVH01003963.1.p1  ORF type:complete len:127 (-),score=21.62 GHVH01003963.1:43-423(-)